jgi:Transposase DDE domain group 1
VKILNHKKLSKRKRKIEKRLERRNWEEQERPMFKGSNIHYELDGRDKGIACGGIGVIHTLAKRIGLVKGIDKHLHLLKRHLPYHESDHVLNIVYNVLAGGEGFEDIELLRQDEGWMDAIGAEIIPDPTTAGDFVRRFSVEEVMTLMEVINETRTKVWDVQPREFFKKAILNVDGTIAETTGECKEGMDISHKGIWGYGPLLISLGQTREPLYLVNRSGNAPSHLDSAVWIDRSLDLVEGRFEEVWLRGDTDFSLTEHLDRWDKRCRFVLGFDAYPNLVGLARGISEECWEELDRKPKYEVKTRERQRPDNVKDRIVRERGYKKIETVSEQVAEMPYRPGKCQKGYRMVVLRKNLTVEKGEVALFDEIRYFFYITNDTTMSPAEVVFFANDRCDHENDIEQLKNGVQALRMPSDDLVSNWAYMVIAALAWNLKAWVGLWMPNKGLGKRIVRMEFKRFLNTFIKIPCLIVKTGRRILYRVEGYNHCLKDYLRAFLMIKACRVT